MIYLKTDGTITQNENCAIMLGNFDGIHLGHQALYNELDKIAKEKNQKKVVFSFSPHPFEYFTNKTFPSLLTSAEKALIFSQMGVNIFVEYPFNKECANMTPEDFIKDVLYEKMKCKTLIVGEEFRFGKNQEGTIEFLLKIGKKWGIEIISFPHISIENIKISSSQIRKYVHDKDFPKAKFLMGRDYYIKGFVTYGQKIGRTIGFPTVNILIEKNKILPPNGIYITKTEYNGNLYNSVTNIGVNPTVNGQERKVETFIYNFNENIYGKEIFVSFYKWVRDERKFANLEQLKTQISLDVLEGKKYFEEN